MAVSIEVTYFNLRFDIPKVEDETDRWIPDESSILNFQFRVDDRITESTRKAEESEFLSFSQGRIHKSLAA